MEVFQPHIHAFGIKSIITVAREKLGPAALEEILRGFGTSSQEVSDPNAWFSIQFVEAVLEQVGGGSIADASTDGNFFRRLLTIW